MEHRRGARGTPHMIGGSELLPASTLALCREAEGSQYASYPVIRAQTPEDLDWVSTRDNSEIMDLIISCMAPLNRRPRGWGQRADGSVAARTGYRYQGPDDSMRGRPKKRA